jgi:hypothetical protein
MLPTKTQHEQEEARLLDRWDWITESIDDYDTRLNTAIVLENTYDKMVKEGQVPRDWLERTLNEDTLNEDPNVGTAQVGVNLIPKVMFPLIRRVFPSLIANKLVSVQPLSQPTGVVYYMRYGYDTTKGDITAGNEYSALPQEATPAFSTYFSAEKIGPFTMTVAASGYPTGSTSATPATAYGGTTLTSFLGTSAPATGVIKRIEVYNAGTTPASTSCLSFGKPPSLKPSIIGLYHSA